MGLFSSVWSGVKTVASLPGKAVSTVISVTGKAKDKFVSLPPVKKAVAVTLTTTAVGLAGAGGVIMVGKYLVVNKIDEIRGIGETGHIILVNGTDKKWVIKDKQSNRMNKWSDSFPAAIESGEVKTVDFEFSRDAKSANAVASYKIDGNDKTFEIKLNTDDPFLFQAVFTNLKTKDKPTVIPLGQHESYWYFILAGSEGNYTGNGLDTANWMKNNKNLIGDRRLMEICLPGSHDSGMSQTTWMVPGTRESQTRTHTKNIAGQLELGTRFFDIRPVSANGSYFTAHLQEQDIQVAKFLGATGQDLNDVIKQVNDFTENHDELVILNFSHAQNIDKRDTNQAPVNFNQNDWDKLIRYLNSNVKRLVFAPADADLSRMKLNELLKGDQKVIILLAEDKFTIPLTPEFHGKGFFSKADNFAIYDEYANKKEVGEMKDNQIDKLKKQELQYFLLSWTLTQDWGLTSIAGDLLETSDSILKLAEEANGQLAEIYTEVGIDTFPNIIYTDDIRDDQQTALAMAINWKRSIFPNYGPKPLAVVYDAKDFKFSNSNPYEDFSEPGKILPIEKYVKNDTASSIKVANGYKVTLYENTDGSGEQRVIDGDTVYDVKDFRGLANLTDFNDKASSLKIEKKPQTLVVLYQDGNFSGASDEFYELGKLLLINKKVKNDEATSIKVARGYKVTLYENAEGTGKEVVFDGDTGYDVAGYKGWANFTGDFNDKASSLKIEKKNQSPVVVNNEAPVPKIEEKPQPIIVYEGPDFTKASDEFYELDKLVTLNKNVGNDKASSIKVPSGYKVILYENSEGTGKELTIDGDTEYDVKGSKGWANLSQLNFSGLTSNLKIVKK